MQCNLMTARLGLLSREIYPNNSVGARVFASVSPALDNHWLLLDFT